MSIATEIQDLNTNLTAAKKAVVEKGGTVGDTGLGGLTEEILGIPSGGGSVKVGDYGKVAYYSKLTYNVEDVSADGCTAEVVAPEKLVDYAEDGPEIRLMYMEGAWQVGWEGEKTYTTEEVEANVGVRITDIESEGAEVSIMGEITVDQSSDRKECAVNSQTELDRFCSGSSGRMPKNILLSNGDVISGLQIIEFVLGSEVINLLNAGFLCRCSNLRFFDNSLATNLATVGDGFLYICGKVSGKMDFPNLTSVGDNFLTDTGVSKLTMPNIESIGDNFCSSSKLESPVDMRKIQTIGDYFCAYCNFLPGFDFSGSSNLRTIGKNAFLRCGIRYLHLQNASNIQSVGEGFAYDCNSLIQVNFPSVDISGAFASSNTSFSSNETAPSYILGILCTGNYSGIQTKFPNSTTYYRKWRS